MAHLTFHGVLTVRACFARATRRCDYSHGDTAPNRAVSGVRPPMHFSGRGAIRPRATQTPLCPATPPKRVDRRAQFYSLHSLYTKALTA